MLLVQYFTTYNVLLSNVVEFEKIAKNTMCIVNNKQFWAEGSGLLPVHLSPVEGQEKYILLDGGLYDFCLDLTDEDVDAASYYSAAWSADVKNYIAVRDDNAIVYNWSRKQMDKVKLDIVRDKFSAFLKILNSISYRTSDDVTPFILGLFSQLRNLTQERKEPTEALNLLFKLLITLQNEHITQEICNLWGITNVAEPVGFENLQISIREGVRQIVPNLDYILRHGSGPLFEIAHREALYFDPQFNLFGEVSSNIGYALHPKYTGIHYTPRYLVRSIVENALKSIDLQQPSLTILDPACGSGTFLQEVLKQLRERDYQGQITLKGFDVSPMAEQTSRFLLNYENRKQWDNRLIIDVICQESLDTEWGDNDLILMNPPFMSSELIKDADTKERINMVLVDLHMKKRPNMAAAFFYKAILSLRENGVLGAVLPSSIFLQEQYQPLRDVARQAMKIETVAQLGNFVFRDALTDTSFVIASKKVHEGYTPLNIWCSNREQSAFDAMRGWRKMHYDNVSQRITEHFNIYTPSHFPLVKKSWKIVPLDDDIFLQKIKTKEYSGDLKSLSNIFDVRQGIIKGNRELFEIGFAEYDALPKVEKRLFRPLASSQTIESGQIKEGRYLWFPYSQLGSVIHSEDELHNYEWSYNWLLPHKEVLRTRKGINNWWDLTRARIELFSHEDKKLCSKRHGGSHSFAIASENYVVEEGNVFLFRNTKYCEEDKYFYLALFSSTVFQRLLSIYARPLKAGYDLGKIQIKDIPVVDVACHGIRGSEEYRQLVSLGMEYANGYMRRNDLFDKFVLAFF